MLAFLKLDLSKKVVINVDETWIGISDFRCRKWCRPAGTNSVPKLQISPRISMIVALDSTGDVFFSLLQANSNSEIMGIFFQRLVEKLDSERPGWRNTSYILLDNAPYHKSAASLKLFEDLLVPVIYTGPHSYDASPVELFFAAFKAVDVNPRHVKTGKK